MLKKAQIAAIPRQAVPPIGRNDWAAAAEVVDGLLIVDIVGTDGTCARYANDGKNEITAVGEGAAMTWVHKDPRAAFGECGWTDMFCAVSATAQTTKRCTDFLKASGVSSWRIDSRTDYLFDALAVFGQAKREEERGRAYNAKRALFRQHLRMFPPLPDDVYDWGEAKGVFAGKYLFISKISKGKRRAVCSCCGERYTIAGGRHREESVCRRCGARVVMIGDWYNMQLAEVDTITVCHKVDGQLLIRTGKLRRTFLGAKKQYSYDDTALVLYLSNGKIYSYWYGQCGFGGYDWHRERIGYPKRSSGWVYDHNLREVFGERYYNVDLTALANTKGPICMVDLLDELKANPAAEYLYKLGLYRLAAKGVETADTDKPDFGHLLGINPQYKQMYKDLDVDCAEHRIIAAAKGYVHAEDVQAMRDLLRSRDANNWYDSNAVVRLVRREPLGKVMRYIAKQVDGMGGAVPGTRRDRAGHCTTWLRDYWEMCDELQIDMSNKSVRWPRDLKAEHDRLAVRVDEVRHAAEEARHRKEMLRVMREVYPRIRIPDSQTYTAALPTCRADFVREGQSLNHCVGRMGYYESHCRGQRLIVFIRRCEEPDKPYYTMEMDVEERRIIQLYGYGDKAAPKEVRAYAERLVKSVRPAAGEEKSAV